MVLLPRLGQDPCYLQGLERALGPGVPPRVPWEHPFGGVRDCSTACVGSSTRCGGGPKVGTRSAGRLAPHHQLRLRTKKRGRKRGQGPCRSFLGLRPPAPKGSRRASPQSWTTWPRSLRILAEKRKGRHEKSPERRPPEPRARERARGR